MIIRPGIQPTDAQSIIDFYKTMYGEMHVVTCNVCNTDLCIEIAGNIEGQAMHPNGYTVIPISDKLLSTRVRLDGMMGYQCLCGNDTRANIIEEALSPTGAMHPHEVAAIHKQMAAVRYKPDIKQKGNKQIRETFTVERIQ